MSAQVRNNGYLGDLVNSVLFVEHVVKTTSLFF